MKKTILTAIFATTLGIFSQANADQTTDAMIKKQMYDMTQQTAGLIAYCVDQGLLTKDSLVTTKKTLDYILAMPGELDTREGDALATLGRSGKLLEDDGTPVTLKESASKGVKAWCINTDKNMREGVEAIEQ